MSDQPRSFVGRMGVLFPPVAQAEGGAALGAKARIVSAFKAGLMCAFGSILLNLTFRITIQPDDLSSQIGTIVDFGKFPYLKHTAVITIGPVIETLIFLIFWLTFDEMKFRQDVKDVLFIATMAFLGFLLHGADWMAVSRAFGFFVLAVLFAGWAHRGPLRFAFGTTALGHSFWNGFALLILASIGWVRS